MDRYYLVKAGTETHKTITAMHAKRAKGMAERWKFVKREFPAAKKKSSGYETGSWYGANDWGVKIPRDAQGTTTIPSPDWKSVKNTNGAIKPKVSTKRGKELQLEMLSEKYAVPGATEFGDALGIKPEFSLRDGGFQLRSPSFTAANNGDYILTLYGKMKEPKDATRISDIEVEKLTAEATPKKATAKKRAAAK